MRPAGWVGLAALALAAALAAGAPAAADPPQDTGWTPITLEGEPRGLGFLEGGLVYGTGDAGGVAGTAAVDCTVNADDADLFLVTFPDGPGCADVLDTSDVTEGVSALSTARRADRALVALPADGSQGLPGDNVQAYERDDANLTPAWTTTVNGVPLEVALDPDARHGTVAFRTGSGDHRMRVFSGAGDRQAGFGLPGRPLALETSDNGRYVAVGGNVTQGDVSLGWARLYDLSIDEDENPVIDRTVPRPRAGIVASLAATDDGVLYGGLLDGTARLFRQGGNDREVSVASDPAHVAVSPDEGTVLAAAGNVTARLSSDGDGLGTEWVSFLNGTARDAIVRPPYGFATAQALAAFGPDGDALWETTAGSVVAANGTGRGLALASSSDGTGQGPVTSTLGGRVLQANLTVDQGQRLTLTPGGVRRVNLTFDNGGAAVLNLTPTASAEGLEARSDPATFRSLPGQSRVVPLTVRAARTASPGPRSVPLDLAADPPVAASPRLDARVTSRPNVTLAFAGGEVADREVTQGQEVSVRVSLQNRGNAEAEVDLRVLQSVPDAWPTEVTPGNRLTVPGGSATTARVDMRVPAGTPNGTRNQVIVRAVTDQGSPAVPFNLTVNPFEVLRLRPDTITQQLAPGQARPYDLSVENLGSVDADVRLRVQPIGPDGEPCLSSVWGLALEASRITVPAQGSNPVRVEITAPAEVPVPEVENGTAGCSEDARRPTLRAELQARSSTGARAESLLFANVDPSLTDPAERPNREPWPGAAVLAAVLAGAATVLGRRNP